MVDDDVVEILDDVPSPPRRKRRRTRSLPPLRLENHGEVIVVEDEPVGPPAAAAAAAPAAAAAAAAAAAPVAAAAAAPAAAAAATAAAAAAQDEVLFMPTPTRTPGAESQRRKSTGGASSGGASSRGASSRGASSRDVVVLDDEIPFARPSGAAAALKRKREEPPAEERVEEKEPIDFNDTAPKTPTDYRNAALAYLDNEFPDVHKRSIAKVFQKHNHHMWPALREMRAVRQGEPEGLKERLRDAGLMKMGNPRKPVNPQTLLSCDLLTRELKFMEREARRAQERADADLARKINTKEAEDAHALIECGCCYCEVAFEDCVQCSEGCLFCATCLARYAQEKLFGSGCTGLKCMSAKECPGSFSEAFLRRALPPKVFQKYIEEEATLAIEKADLPDLVSCHHCQFRCLLDANVDYYTCPKDDGGCGKSQCRKCGEEPHRGQLCEKKETSSARRQLEEAMSEALLRKCPKCKRPFVKEQGCNKMTCAACKTLSCYVCKKQIPGYQHFCQQPVSVCDHTRCKRCPLFSDSEADDRRAVEEAAKAQKAKAEQAGVDLSSVDLPKLLHDPTSEARRRQPNGLHGPALVQGLAGIQQLNNALQNHDVIIRAPALNVRRARAYVPLNARMPPPPPPPAAAAAAAAAAAEAARAPWHPLHHNQQRQQQQQQQQQLNAGGGAQHMAQGLGQQAQPAYLFGAPFFPLPPMAQPQAP